MYPGFELGSCLRGPHEAPMAQVNDLIAGLSTRDSSLQISSCPKQEDLAVPVEETDDPVKVVTEAWQAFIPDAGHTCHGELTNNSGPGSLETSLIEAQGQDRI